MASYSAGSSQLCNFSHYMAAIDLTQDPINSLHEFYSFVKIRVQEHA